MKTMICHLGLGDAIVLAGAVVSLLEDYDELAFPCLKKNEKSVRQIFRLYPQVQIIPLNGDFELLDLCKTVGNDIIKSGYFLDSGRDRLANEPFDEWFYRQLEVPFENRWKLNPLPGALISYLHEGAGESNEYRSSNFVHDDPSRGYKIDPAFLPERSNYFPDAHDQGLLYYGRFLATAQQIHVIDSCFLHLCESLPTIGSLFLHRYARHDALDPLNYVKLKKDWTILC